MDSTNDSARHVRDPWSYGRHAPFCDGYTGAAWRWSLRVPSRQRGPRHTAGRRCRARRYVLQASRRRDLSMSRALVAGGSLGGLTAALVLRDQGWDVDVLERSAVPLQDRGAGIVAHPPTIRYLVERVGKAIGDSGVPASRLRYLGDDGSVAHEQSCAYRFASYFELYQGLLDAFGTEHYHLSTQLAHLDNRGDQVALSMTDGETLTADLLVCADGIRSTGRAILVPDAQPRYVGYVAWRGTIEHDELSGRTASILRDAITYRFLSSGPCPSPPTPRSA